MINLTPSQERVVNEFSLFLDNDNQREMVIAGAAGTGKSFLVAYLLEKIKLTNQVRAALGIKNSITPYLTATTNKAVDVLSKATRYNTLGNYYCTTIHQLLGLSVISDLNSKNTSLHEKRILAILPNSVVFVDEASMVDKNLFKIITKALKDYNRKIVYIGDNYQLPPIEELESVVFNSSNIFYLTDIMRQGKDNPIIELSIKFKEILDKGPPFKWPDIITDNQNIFKIKSKDEFGKLAKEKFQDMGYHNNKVLAYTNDTVNRYNAGIRKFYTGEVDFQSGEYVTINSPIVDNKGNIRLYSNEDVFINSIKPIRHPKYAIDGFSVSFFINGVTPEFFYPKSFTDKRILLNKLAEKKEWANYHEVKNTFLDLRSPYALTCHKSQGSTYENVFIDLDDISRNRKWHEIVRLLYVAITRASNAVYFYGNLSNQWE